MKQLILITWLLLMPIMGQAQLKTNTDSLQAVIQLSLKKIHARNVRVDYQTLEKWNKRLSAALKQLAVASPEFMQVSFQDLGEYGLVVLTANDSNFRIVCWNDQTSGTMQEWRAFGFWKSGDGLKFSELPPDKPQEAWRDGDPEYRDIWTIRRKDGQIIYLVHGRNHIDTSRKADFIKAYTISQGNLRRVKLFKTPSKYLCKIRTEMNLATISRDNNNPFIHLSDDKNTLFIPVVKEEGNVQNGYFLVYQFDGKNFVYQGVENKK